MHTSPFSFGSDPQGSIPYGSSVDTWSGSAYSMPSSVTSAPKSRMASMGNMATGGHMSSIGNMAIGPPVQTTVTHENAMRSQQFVPLTSPFGSNSQASSVSGPFAKTSNFVTGPGSGSNLSGYSSPASGQSRGVHNMVIAPEDKSEAYLDGGGMNFISSPLDQPVFTMGPENNKVTPPNLIPVQPVNETGAENPWNQNNPFSFKGQFGQQLSRFGELYNERVKMNQEDELNDPPLLEELDIDVMGIYRHLKAVLFFHRGDNIFSNYTDLSGPVLIFILFGFALLFSGKLCFKIIYVMSLLSNVVAYLFFNVLSQGPYINFSKVFTIFGYSLLPICFAPIIFIFSGLIKTLCIALVYGCVIWSTFSASHLIKAELGIQDRQYLTVYPIFLYYTAFANIVIF